MGSLLTAKSGVWGENMNFSFQWLRDGEPIPYMSEKTYRLQPVDRGRQITVEIHGFARGYLPRTVASAPLYIADQIPGYAITGYRVSGVAADCNSGFESDIIRVTTPQAAQDYVYSSDPNTASFPIKRVTPVYDAPGATRSFIIEGRGCDGSLVHRKRVTASSPEQARSQYWGAFPDSFRAAFIDVTIP
ncbi:hypothetical protein A9Z40_08220 [Microbacterium arborescens]|uniref:Uncharacterized protein n=1 Tax=Microbacterium arborescens TaxID=33883 RepID=A0ABX2WHI4_9MICO|nr:hypothetical protein A9Z40_08220 [Microbacterium arborescens]